MTTITQINPATGDVLGDLPEWTSEQIRDAMEHARSAFPAWRDTPLAERLRCIRQMRQYLVDQADALAKGAQVECGGRPLQEGTLHYAPTIVTGVDHSMRLMQEETFGPVMPVMTFRTE